VLRILNKWKRLLFFIGAESSNNFVNGSGATIDGIMKPLIFPVALDRSSVD
jgi:hypothetical protein